MAASQVSIGSRPFLDQDIEEQVIGVPDPDEQLLLGFGSGLHRQGRFEAIEDREKLPDHAL